MNIRDVRTVVATGLRGDVKQRDRLEWKAQEVIRTMEIETPGLGLVRVWQLRCGELNGHSL